MDVYSSQITNLVEQLSHLPGIGAKSAQRLAFHILNMTEESDGRAVRGYDVGKEKCALLQRMLYIYRWRNLSNLCKSEKKSPADHGCGKYERPGSIRKDRQI